MTEGLEAITTAAIGLALDAAALRQRAIAANIANAGTQGYVPVKVNFEEQLEDARSLLRTQRHLEAGTLAEIEPRAEPVAAGAGGVSPKVLLDVEVAELASNAFQYQALLKGLSRHYGILSAAVGDGKK